MNQVRLLESPSKLCNSDEGGSGLLGLQSPPLGLETRVVGSLGNTQRDRDQSRESCEHIPSTLSESSKKRNWWS